MRFKCPFCGGMKLKEVDDRTKPLYYFKNGKKPMFAKKFVCTNCNYEWNTEQLKNFYGSV